MKLKAVVVRPANSLSWLVLGGAYVNYNSVVGADPEGERYEPVQACEEIHARVLRPSFY